MAGVVEEYDPLSADAKEFAIDIHADAFDRVLIPEKHALATEGVVVNRHRGALGPIAVIQIVERGVCLEARSSSEPGLPVSIKVVKTREIIDHVNIDPASRQAGLVVYGQTAIAFVRASFGYPNRSSHRPVVVVSRGAGVIGFGVDADGGTHNPLGVVDDQIWMVLRSELP